LAFSPIARDQLLAVALGLAADRLERGAFMAESGSAVLEMSDSTETERLAIQRDVFGAGRAPAGQAGRIANALEIRYRPECRSAHELAARLREDAALHQRLWDHPSLPCDSRTRLLMHDSVRGLLERADRLAMVLHPDQQRPSP
jgi:hypothetical protein